MQHYLSEKQYEEEEDIESDLLSFFESKSKEFYRRGIEELPKRWETIIDNMGDYIID